MPTTAAATVTASDVIRSTQAAVAKRIDDESYANDWSDSEKRNAYVDVLRSITVWRTADRCVTATVADTRYGRIWGYAAGEALDCGAADLDAAGFDFESGLISKLSDTVYQLTW